MTKESILYLLSSDHRPTRSIYDLSRSDIHSLLYRSDLSETDSHGMNVLMHTLSSNRYKNLNLSSEQWGYLIDNSNLKQISVNGVSALYAYAKDHVYEKVVLSKTQQNLLFDGFFKEADLEDPKIKQTGDWLLDVVFMSQKNVDNLFTQNRIDYLIDHFNLKNFFLSSNDLQGMIEKNYVEYCIEREKRVLSSALASPLNTPKSETFKL